MVGLYLDPPDRALVLCCNEKSQCQALERTQPGLPLGQGHIRTQTHDYYRYGTVTFVGAFLDHHNLHPRPYRGTADPKRILEKPDRAWETLLEEIYNPVYGTSH